MIKSGIGKWGLMVMLLVIGIFVFSSNMASASQWVKTYGDSNADIANCIQQTTDGGYIVAGRSSSFGTGPYDAWVLKLDGNGIVQWQKTYGGSGDNDWINSIQQTTDGGYILAGGTYSDVLVLKLDGNGNIQWQKTYGGTGSDVANSIQQTTDGGYIVAGQSSSFDAGLYDAWVFKLDAIGNVQWQKTYGGTSNLDWANSIQQTSDGGYVVAGSFGALYGAAWVLKLDAIGNVQWQKKTYDGPANSIQQTTDGGYIVGGQSWSFFAWDAWALKLDESGNMQWQKTYGGSNTDKANSIQQTTDGGYVVAGQSFSFGAGNYDAWVLKIDGSGNIYNVCSIVKTSNALVTDTNANVGIPMS